MKNNLKVNFSSKTIEVSPSFVKKAGIYGSTEYLMLIDVKTAYPEYKIEPQKSKKSAIKGIDYDFMRNYIITHDETAKMLTAFEKLVKGNLSYPEVKAWFVEQYPVFKDCKTRAEWILAA